MAYKKYIKKNGKIYGPYIYHSKRVDGKVVSEYHGLKEGTIKKVNKSPLFFIFAAVALVLFFTLFFTLKPSSLSGNVILNLEGQYQEDQPLEGVLSINLKEGEMIPEDSKIVFENAGENYEYALNDLILNKLIEGEYYVEGSESFGQGFGYGLIGSNVVYPEVYFKFKVISSSLEGNLEEATFNQVENTTESIVEEQTPKNVTEEQIIENITEEQPIEEIVENVSEETVSEIVEEQSTEEIVEVQVVEEQTLEEVIEEQFTEEVVETPEESVSTEIEAIPETSSEPSITGNVARGVFGSIINLFMGIRPTGNVVSEGDEVQADVSYAKEFKYNIQPGQTIKILPGSVRTDTKELSVSDLQVFIQENSVIIKTNYYEETHGFGKNYIGKNMENININLSALNLSFKDKSLGIKLVHGDKEIKSFKVNLGDSFLESSDNETMEDANELIYSLTDSEKKILSDEFGNESINQNAREYKDWIIVSLKLGSYEVEYSYNKDLSRADLNSLIEKDKINWLRDISNEITKEETPSFKLDEFNQNYDFS